jgi:hypothetical protein
MGADRFIHKRAGSGDRVNKLNDLEFRFWVFYELGADDFGVIRNDVAAFIETHPYFATVKPALAKAALASMVTIMDLVRFKTHGLEFLCQRDWQDFQKGEWAQVTTRPRPEDAIIATFTPWTQALFSVWPGQSRIPPNPDGTKKRRNSNAVATPSQPNSDNVARESLDRGNGFVSGNGHSSEGSPDRGSSTSADDAARFLEGYRERYQRITGATLPISPSPKDVANATEMLKTWPLPRLLTMAELFLHRDDREVAGKPKTIGYFKPMAPWCDARLREAGR